MNVIGTIDRQDQFSALADEHRRAIFRRLMSGPSTISRLGREFDRHPAWIRHHLKRLESVGLVELDSILTTRNYTEKFYRTAAGAYAVHLMIGPDTRGTGPVLVLGSDDLALEALASETSALRGARAVVPAAIGSLDGLIALRQGLADVAGCHLLDADTGEYNIPYLRHLFPGRPVAGVTLALREQGLVTAPGNPLQIRDVEDLARPGLRFANRRPGSGTRVWIDRTLRDRGIDTANIAGYDSALCTHAEVAESIEAGRADAGLAIRTVAESRGLGFVPLFTERYDLVTFADRMDDAPVARLFEHLASRPFRAELRRMPGYSSDRTGDVLSVAA